MILQLILRNKFHNLGTLFIIDKLNLFICWIVKDFDCLLFLLFYAHFQNFNEFRSFRIQRSIILWVRWNNNTMRVFNDNFDCEFQKLGNLFCCSVINNFGNIVDLRNQKKLQCFFHIHRIFGTVTCKIFKIFEFSHLWFSFYIFLFVWLESFNFT